MLLHKGKTLGPDGSDGAPDKRGVCGTHGFDNVLIAVVDPVNRKSLCQRLQCGLCNGAADRSGIDHKDPFQDRGSSAYQRNQFANERKESLILFQGKTLQYCFQK